MKWIGILLAVVACIIVVRSCVGNVGSRGGGGGSVEGDAEMWLPFNDGMALAAKEQKPVVIDFYTSWCHWCKVMDKETFSNPEVKKYLAENFVTIRVDAESETGELVFKGQTYTPAALARNFGVTGYPSLAYLDRDGELLRVVPGFFPAKHFLPLLRGVLEEKKGI